MLIETDQLRPALHVHPQGVQLLDQQSLVSVLRIDQNEGVRGQPLANPLERHPRGFGASHPEVEARNLDASRDERIGHSQLAVELQRANLYGQGAGGGARLGGLVDDPHGTPSRSARGKHEAGGPGPNDQDRGIGHRFHSGVKLLFFPMTRVCSRRPRIQRTLLSAPGESMTK